MEDLNLTSAPGMVPEDIDQLVWFSYLTVDYSYHTKRYLDWVSYQEAGDSDFVLFCTRPYAAASREPAVAEGKRLIRKYREDHREKE